MKILLFIGLMSISQMAKAEDCSSVIALSRISSTTISSKNSLEQAAAKYCNEYASAKAQGKSMTAGASYGPISGSFGQSSSNSESIASRICSSDDNSKRADNAYQEYVNAIAPGAYGAYEQCLTLQSTDIRFSVDEAAILPRQLVMTVNYTNSNGQSQNAQLSYSASEGVACKWSSGAAANIQMQSPQTVSLACSRPAANSKAFITVMRADGAGKISLPWAEYTAEGVPVNLVATMNQKITSLSNRLVDQESALAAERVRLVALENSMQTERANIVYSIANNSVGCPSGWTKLGTIGFIVSSADYGTANIGTGAQYVSGWTWTHPFLCKRS